MYIGSGTRDRKTNSIIRRVNMDSGFSAVNLPARFVSAGRTVAGPGWVYPKRRLNTHELIVVKQGCFGMTVNGQNLILAAGQAILLPAGPEHCGFHAEQEQAPVYYWAHFEDESLSGRETDGLHTLPVSLPDPVFDRVISEFHHLMNRSSTVKGHSDLCDYLLSVILLEIQQDEPEKPHSAVVSRMLEYIRLHCFEKLDWHDLSLALGYTEDYLSRRFHDHMNCSFRQYIHLLRMDRARRELLSSEKSVQQIAAECGYSNAKFFSTVFMKCEGLSPSDYRNQFGRIHQDDD